MTFYLISGLFIGIVFSLIGAIGLIFSSQKKNKFLFPFLLGSGVLYVFTLGPLSESQNKLDEIIELDPKEVLEIRVKPSQTTSRKNMSLLSEFIIQDRESIDRICQTLKQAKKVHNGYAESSTRLARIEIKTQTHNIAFGMREIGNKTGLVVFSNGETGWNYGTLACDELGQVIQEEIKKAKE